MNALPAPLLFGAREAELAMLDRLPRALWLQSLVHSQGRLAPRLAAIAHMRASLRGGAAPAAGTWPHAALARAIDATFTRLELPRYCAAHADLGDQVLRSLLWHLDRIVDSRDRGLGADEAEHAALEDFASDWSERTGEIDELVHVLGDAGDLLKNTQWDMLRGLLRSGGWQQMLRIRAQLAQLPDLARMIRALGRARQTEMPEAARRTTLPVMQQEAAEYWSTRVIRVPELPGETRGVRRSGRVARMLPSEALLLAHPRLRLVWHARHAERTLLTYEDDDRLHAPQRETRPVWRERRDERPDRRLEAGPLIVCVDTSGSMQGGAEAVAKAAVLEAARCAHEQQRACHVFAFSGPDEVVGMELGFDHAGVERLAQFMGQGFRGGTDICGPLERALAMLSENTWQLADLVIASDGEFGATAQLAQAVAHAKDQLGLRVQGILIGDRETIGMLELADDIFWVRDWRRYGMHDSEQPLASKSLTATYFPGALRVPQARRAAPVDAGAAAAALRRGDPPA